MSREKTILSNVLRNYCNVNARDRRWTDAIREFLQRDPQRGAQFKTELDAAIDNGTLSAAECERLTDEDFDTQEDLVEWLKELRNLIYPLT